MIAVELERIYSGAAKERQTAPLKRGNETPVIAPVQKPIHAAEQAATVMGDQLRASLQGHQWWIGDWLRFGGHKWGDKYEAAAEQLGMNAGTLKNFKSVAEAYPELSLRNYNLTFQHHVTAAPLPPVERDLKLSEAAEQGWSAAQLRARAGKGYCTSARTYCRQRDRRRVGDCARRYVY